MKLQPGQKVVIGGRTFTGEIPDGIAAAAGIKINEAPKAEPKAEPKK
jgi:hypothetical protein